MDTVLPEEFGMTGACRVPVHERGIGYRCTPAASTALFGTATGSLTLGGTVRFTTKIFRTPASACIISSNMSAERGPLLPIWTTTTSPS